MAALAPVQKGLMSAEVDAGQGVHKSELDPPVVHTLGKHVLPASIHVGIPYAWDKVPNTSCGRKNRKDYY